MDEALKMELMNLFSEINENNPSDCDKFFDNEKFFPGNVINQKYLLYDRFEIYEENLKLLKENFPEKFEKAHKGTPQYLLA
ncbi:MAG: hypothetical protein HYW01_03870 [Deltaproteobacteria bacterium]|nr:hypothetical protein [Deltaproteobacteria bacterium]